MASRTVGQQIFIAARFFCVYSGGTLMYTGKKVETVKMSLQNAHPGHLSPPSTVLITPGIRSLDAH